jgi:outer membrane protein assembly factor BamE (lipoprotein component of BamABCDE complex)
MNRLIAIAVSGAVLGAVAACAAPSSVTNDLRAGMTKHQVIALMGTPDGGAADPEKECSYYNLHRNRWSGPGGGSPDRYAVCFQKDAVTSFVLERGPRLAGYPPPELPLP